jgi:hypothetical protein
LVNSSYNLNGMSNPVSKYAFKTTGSVPQPGPEASFGDGSAALADGAAALAVATGAGDWDTAPGEAHAPTTLAMSSATAKGAARQVLRVSVISVLNMDTPPP